MSQTRPAPADSAHALAAAFVACRRYTDTLCAGLTAEDQGVQSMPDASPAKWHRAHTTWFFEQFVLLPYAQGYRPFDPRYPYLFNSYYEAIGLRHPRPARGLLTRPAAAEVGDYRAAIDAAIEAFCPTAPPDALALIELGIHHEQQHQELLLTDILHAFAQNPLLPAAIPGWLEPASAPGPTQFVSFRGGLTGIGQKDGAGFGFDNERPRHQHLLAPYRLASRLVRNQDFAEFIADGGYRTASLWMSEGWDIAGEQGWSAPLYWRQTDAGPQQFTPAGLVPLDGQAPVRHVSWYEADAFARWAGARLPTESELEAGYGQLAEFGTHAWQWTSSAYGPYPGFRAAEGAVGEYNGKFMINQMALRGGSMATPPGHSRATYRNFFHPDKRWQFTGLRLAQDS